VEIQVRMGQNGPTPSQRKQYSAEASTVETENRRRHHGRKGIYTRRAEAITGQLMRVVGRKALA
jgi:hypothetical protein